MRLSEQSLKQPRGDVDDLGTILVDTIIYIAVIILSTIVYPVYTLCLPKSKYY